MAVRIYSLAKELNIDNKELVSICEKAGLRGKGSALASLEDDEVAKVKNYISEQATPSQKNPENASVEAHRVEKPARAKSPMRDFSAKLLFLGKAKKKEM
ncbi:MAG: translation initiation factor IF-2 N-terminal domain-containing protein [Planctomycetota bacterium]|nr:translation initiation factor IF-2 N-terminal domain-containing protein [Planctomycetota bacterium]